MNSDDNARLPHNQMDRPRPSSSSSNACKTNRGRWMRTKLLAQISAFADLASPRAFAEIVAADVRRRKCHKVPLRESASLRRRLRPTGFFTSRLRAFAVQLPDLAETMQSGVTLALTLTLSPRRGNRQWLRRKNSSNGEPFPALEKILPLPGGEGRGEGECEFQLNCSDLV